MTEIRDDSADPAVIEAAARPRLGAARRGRRRTPREHIRGCADFQALMPDYRAGRLPEARALLVKDHLHECVACRHVYEGKVVAMPAARPASAPQLHRALGRGRRRGGRRRRAVRLVGRRPVRRPRRAAPSCRPSTAPSMKFRPTGIQPLLAVGQELPDGVELRTAKDSDAMLQLDDGSRGRVARALRLFHHADRQRSHHSPGPRQHHRAGRQAQLGAPVCRHRRLPRGGHRHRVQRQHRA